MNYSSIFLATLGRIYSAQFFINVFSKNSFIKKIKLSLAKKRLKPLVCLYIYLGSYYFLFKDKEYLYALNRADQIYLDGFLVGWFKRWLFKQNVERFGAEDYIYSLVNICALNNKKMFLVGSDDSEQGVKGAILNLKKRYPKLKISGHYGYFHESKKVVDEIKNFNADLLIVGLGLGRQEKWIYDNLDNLKDVNTIIAVGNFIDILGGKTSLPPEIFKKINLRWAFRLFKEPSRLGTRYLLGGLLFAVSVIFCIIANLRANRKEN